jgi:hypothetical protein
VEGEIRGWKSHPEAADGLCPPWWSKHRIARKYLTLVFLKGWHCAKFFKGLSPPEITAVPRQRYSGVGRVV